jgi:hypothetical protein
MGLESIVGEADFYSLNFSPSSWPIYLSQRNLALHKYLGQLQSIQSALKGANLESPTPSDMAVIRQATKLLREVMPDVLSKLAANFLVSSDFSLERISRGYLAKAYYDSPRITILSFSNAHINIDLGKDNVRALAHPGQSIAAEKSLQFARGLLESWLESNSLQRASGQTVVSTATVFEQAKNLNIPLKVVAQDFLSNLDELQISQEARSRITHAVTQGKVVIVPERMVPIGNQQVIGWWEVNTQTGELEGVMENGLHNAIVELAYIIIRAAFLGALTGTIAFIATFLINLIVQEFIAIAQGRVQDQLSVFKAAANATNESREL